MPDSAVRFEVGRVTLCRPMGPFVVAFPRRRPPASTRHTFPSWLFAASAPITYVSARLGHATPTTTLRFCAKWIPSKGPALAIGVLDRLGQTPRGC
jgi:hypothetical protein